MSYSEAVLARAAARLEDRRRRRAAQQAARRKEIYAKVPRISEIDRQLQQTTPRIVAAAFRRGEEPQEAIRRLREENLSLQEERAILLAQRGYAPGVLDETPFCPRCGDTGWQGASMCACLKKLCAEEQIRALSSLLDFGEQSFDRFRLDYYSTDVWPEYGRSPRRNMESVVQVCRAYAGQFGSLSVRNLFLSGATGLGKTFLSACIAREVSEGGFSVVYDTAGAIFARFEEQKFSRDAGDVQKARGLTRKYLSCDLLILDDLGSEMATPFVQSALYQLINTRLVGELSTVISSNLTMDGVRQRYTPQIASRLEGEYRTLPFFGEDIRLLRKGTP